MEPKAEVKPTTIVPLAPKIGTPIKVRQATLQSETFWPGKLGAEININPVKYPKIKMLWIDGRGLQLTWEDGSLYTVPQAAVKGFEHE